MTVAHGVANKLAGLHGLPRGHCSCVLEANLSFVRYSIAELKTTVLDASSGVQKPPSKPSSPSKPAPKVPGPAETPADERFLETEPKRPEIES